MSKTESAEPFSAESLTTAEQRFDLVRGTTGIILGPLVFGALLILPLGLDANQQRLAAVLGLVVILWVTEALPIPISAALGLALCVVLEVPRLEEGEDAAGAVFGAFSSGTIFLVIGGFIISRAMVVHGLDRRFALRMLTLRGIAGSTYGVLVAIGAVAALISAFISNSAATAMLLPIGVGIVASLGTAVAEASGRPFDAKRSNFGTGTMLMVAYGASVGGLLTPIGSPANLIGRGFLEEQAGEEISFLQWMATTGPIVAVMFAALCVTVIVLNRPEAGRLGNAHEFLAEERSKLGPLSRGERNTLIAFTLAVVGWVGPSLLALIAGEESSLATTLSARLDEGAVAILAAAILFILPVNWRTRQPTLTWVEAARIDWGTVILVGAGIVFGGLMSSTGLAQTLGAGIADSLGVTSLVSITALAAVIAVLISETTSNTASVGIVVPITIPIALAAGIDPTLPTLAAVFGASYGFMLPVSTPPNAIVYGSGMVPITRMIRTGAAFDAIGVAMVVAGVLVMANLTGIA